MRESRAEVSVSDHYQWELADVARDAALAAGALKVCAFHRYVTVREADPGAQREAYTMALARLQRDDILFHPNDLEHAIDQALVNGGTLRCWACDAPKKGPAGVKHRAEV
jgi:hypothetical protein